MFNPPHHVATGTAITITGDAPQTDLGDQPRIEQLSRSVRLIDPATATGHPLFLAERDLHRLKFGICQPVKQHLQEFFLAI